MRGNHLLSAASAAFIMAFAAPGAFAQDADPPGDQSTQARIGAGETIDGVLSPAEDTDWYRLRAEVGQRYHITLDAIPGEEGGAIDPMLFVYDLGGNQLAFNDDSGGTLNSALHFMPSESTDVYIEARAFNPQVTGPYRLRVEAAPAPEDDFSADTSTRGRASAGRAITGSIDYEGDADWFRLSARTGRVYRISLNGGEAASDLRDPLLRVLGRDGEEELAFNDDGPEGLNSYLEFTPAANGDVFIEARAYADAYTGGYTLNIESAALPRDDYTADTRTRGRIALGQSVTSQLDFNGDRDWFRIRLEEGESYRFALQSAGDSPLGDPLLRLYDSSGAEVAMDDDGGGGLNALLEHTAAASGNYYVEARGYSPNATGGYQLRAMAGDIPADASTDMSLDPSGDFREGMLAPAGDRDWYRLDLEQGQALRISVTGAGTPDTLPDPYLVIYGPDSQELARDDDGGEGLNAWIEFQAAAAGPHYLEVRGFQSDAQGRYAIGIAGGEIGDSIETAEFLSDNNERSSTIGSANDVDWFAIELIEGRPYRFSLNGSDPDPLSDPYLTLYTSEGVEVMADDDGGPGLNSYMSFTPVTGGVYVLAASGFSGATGRYTLRAVDTETPGHIYTDDMLDAAGDTRLNRIDMAGDLDYYAVALEGGVSYQIDLRGAGEQPLADPFLALVDTGANRITEDDDSGPGLDARLRFTPEASGPYFLVASGLGGGVGGYEISIAPR